MTIGDCRADFPALAEIIHLNSAGISPTPSVVTTELLRIPREVAAHGPGLLLAHAEELTHSEEAHRLVAAALGVSADEIAFTLQFSTAASLVLEGLTWRAGDEVIITDQEHPALLTPLLNIVRRYGVKLRRLPVDPDAGAMLAGFTGLLSDRTRLVAMSQVTTENGIRLPVAALSRQAHARGALVLYDGAQAFGQFPVDLPSIDCDFYIIVGYKWAFGPYPSAALYIRRSVLERIEVTWTGSRATLQGAIDMDELLFVPTARRFEFGARPFAEEAAMAAGVAYITQLGPERIEEHAQRLAVELHRRIDAIPGAAIHSPRDPRAATGIVTLSLAGLDGGRVATALRERWRILTRPALQGTSIRVSLAAFTTIADLDRLAEALKVIAAGQG